MEGPVIMTKNSRAMGHLILLGVTYLPYVVELLVVALIAYLAYTRLCAVMSWICLAQVGLGIWLTASSTASS